MYGCMSARTAHPVAGRLPLRCQSVHMEQAGILRLRQHKAVVHGRLIPPQLMPFALIVVRDLHECTASTPHDHCTVVTV